MLSYEDLFKFVFIAASATMVTESAFAIVEEFQNKNRTPLSQAKVWIRTLLMVTLSLVMLYLITNSGVSAQEV